MNTSSTPASRRFALRSSRRFRRITLDSVALTAVTALTVSTLGMNVASANPGDGSPGGAVGQGEVWITSASTVAEGEKLSFAGSGFAIGGNSVAPQAQSIALKLDAAGSTALYTGTGTNGASDGVVGRYQVQGDGTVSGAVVVPSDIDEVAVNPASHDGPHFLRLLGSNPGLSRWSDDFEVDNAAAPAPTVSAVAVTASRRGNTTVTLTVNGSGFAPGESVSVARTQTDTPLAWTVGQGATATSPSTITADSAGNLTGQIVLAPGVLFAGEHQLAFGRSSAPGNPGIAQVVVKPVASLVNVALGSEGTVTLTNAAPGSVVNSVMLDPTAAPGDEVDVLKAPITADAAGVAAGVITVPQDAPLGTRDFVITQSAPYASSLTVSAKVSPSSALLGVDGYARVETADGAIEQGLYQSGYSARSKALFATAASGTSTSTIYKLDPNTLKVIKSVVPATEDATPANKWAAYGVGVDDSQGTVWITNTRQATVAVYDQDLNLLKQFPRDVIVHPRDAVADETNGVVYVSSASEGSNGNGAISVFEADDLDKDGVRFEWIEDLAVYPRTEFSPMSLELDEASGTLFSVSLTSQKVVVIDTATREERLVTLPDLAVGGRGASGVAYDGVTRRLFVASQNSDEVLIAQFNEDFTATSTLKEVPTGAGALNVVFDPINRLAYVANFGGTTITVLNPDGVKVANLPFTRANHLTHDGSGSVYAVNKATGNQVIKVTPKVAAGIPSISGAAVVNQTLTASAGAWTTGATFAYQWLRNGAPVAGAVRSTYALSAADLGSTLSVAITGTATGRSPVSATSRATTAVQPAALTASTPKIKGKAKVGKTVKVKTGSWTAGTTLRYRWTSNGKAVKGAKGARPTMKITKKFRGKRLVVAVTGSKPGHTTVTMKSARTPRVRR